MLEEGLIIKVNSDTFTVNLINNDIIDCKARGKNRYDKVKALVGDRVLVDTNTKRIDKILTRKNTLERPPVSNIDAALIVTSIVKPDINYTLLDKLISIITINNIEPIIVFTKLDLVDKANLKKINEISNYYNKIGIKVFNNKKIKKLKKYLKNKIVAVCGQTGAGKSTLINKFDKRLDLKTDDISDALGRGKHTTRIVELFNLKTFFIVDTPGFSSIDISVYSKDEIKRSFIEFNNIDCKYNNCMHINETGCNIKNNKDILSSRYNSYISFIKESKK